MSRRAISQVVVATVVLLAAMAGSATAAVIRYAWTGQIEPAVGAENPWGLSGDGSALTQDDGTPFTFEVFLDEAAVDEDDGQVGRAEFDADVATLVIDGEEATVTSVEILFGDDRFGTVDDISSSIEAELSSASLFVSFNVRMPTSTFAFPTTAGLEPPPLFVDTLPIAFGSAGTQHVITYPDEAPVTATLPEPPSSAVAASGALLLLARRRRQARVR